MDLWSLDVRPARQECVQKTSARMARASFQQAVKRNERLNLHSAQGHFRARARVAYCEPWE